MLGSLRSPAAAKFVAASFAVSGVVHFARPSVFRPLIPKELPEPDAWIYASGAAELVCAAGLFTNRRWARPASAALLLAVWPGNATYAVKVSRKQGIGSMASLIGWARMPMQIPMIVAVWPVSSVSPERAS
ncbi:MAG: DoxX family protein [Actinobacteria bacterium]|nr:DoxX family protein [Actinomycetota bacterium]